MKSFITIALVIILKIFGNISLSQGMTIVGELKISQILDATALFAFAFQALTNIWVIIAMVFLLFYILLYFSSLSWLDLSYFLPMTTLGYALNALLAWLLLEEEVTLTRWFGTFLIMIGVLVIGIGGHRRSQREKLNKSKIQKSKPEKEAESRK